MEKHDDVLNPAQPSQGLVRRMSAPDRRPSAGAALFQQSSPTGTLRSTFHRYDITASGTTSRLHASLTGRNIPDMHPSVYEENGHARANAPFTVTDATPLGDDDPEQTPLLGNRRKLSTTHQVNSHHNGPGNSLPEAPPLTSTIDKSNIDPGLLRRAAAQLPAIVVLGLFHLMIGIPFGVSYFPVGWRSTSSNGDSTEDGDDGSGIHGAFPVPGKEAFGIRMFLFSTAIGQIVFTFKSQFPNVVGLQMVENVPFCQALARIVIQHQGYGVDALSTLLVIFALSSIVVGSIFWTLGRYRLGRVIYFFPTHVLMGCIGGIGVFLCRTALEVTMDHSFAWTLLIGEKRMLVSVVFGFEILLRTLEHLCRDQLTGKSKYPLLAPVFFLLITPCFYALLWIANIDLSKASEMGFFFPQVDETTDDNSVPQHNAIFDLWSVINLKTVSLVAVWNSIPTIVALSLFSLIHVPLNIPAFGISSNRDVDINNELVAHGWSNLLMGVVGGGGLQNYEAYTQSVLYSRSGGYGKASGMAVVIVTLGLFVVGPTIASFIPRAMAGTLLIHVGIDLFLEAVYDSLNRFDHLEYIGLLLIVIVMSVAGLEAAMIAGVIAAVSTYAVQSITYLNPIRGTMSAATLRSSRYDRSHEANRILDHPVEGRSRILVIQLQGHLFFGNTAQLTETVQTILQSTEINSRPHIVIMDFMLVLGIDSSAAQAMGKLRTILRKQFSVDSCIFVTGSTEGFPTAFGLSKELSQPDDQFNGSHVVSDLDTALSLAEDHLLSRNNPSLLLPVIRPLPLAHKDSGLNEEREVAREILTNLAVEPFTSESIELVFACFQREEYSQNEIIWRQGSPGSSAKIVIRGTLMALIENEAGTSEVVPSGNIVGELGLVYGAARMSTVVCQSEDCVIYSISRDAFRRLLTDEPHAARVLDLICIKYLTGRVQHVSNRVFETRCLPI